METVGIDAGRAGALDPAYPVHLFLLGNDRYGLTQLANLGMVPPTDSLTMLARVLTFIYFAWFLTMPVWSRMGTFKPVPERVTMHD